MPNQPDATPNAYPKLTPDAPGTRRSAQAHLIIRKLFRVVALPYGLISLSKTLLERSKRQPFSGSTPPTLPVAFMAGRFCFFQTQPGVGWILMVVS